MVKKPINPPTNPDAAAEEDRSFFYRISEDRTHYLFIGEMDDAGDNNSLMAALVPPPSFSSKKVAFCISLPWYPGEKCCADGLPYPPTNPPPYEGMTLAEEEDENWTENEDKSNE